MKCQKVPKNPCKICLQKVTNKDGLQCKGVCQTWVHFKCLNYTPGKIHDIKAGIIKVLCPCSNCDTNEAKEVLTNPPFSCTNFKCPANLPPSCESKECASKSPIPYCPSCMYYGTDKSCKSSQSPNTKCPPVPKCESPPIVYNYSPDPRQCVAESTQAGPPTQLSSRKNSFPLIRSNHSQSCSDLRKNSEPTCIQQKMRSNSSDSKVPCAGDEEREKMLYRAIQNLSKTVGTLSTQLRDLMCKLETCIQ